MSLNPTFWDKLAEKYAKQPVGNPGSFEKKIAITQALMASDHTVLDVGCGTGSLVLRLAETGADVHGLDFSPEMIRIANEKTAAAQTSNATFHVGAFDTSFTAFGPDSLDGLCAYSILHLVPDIQAALAHAFTLVKPGGYFVSSTVCLGGPAKLLYMPLISIMRLFGKAPAVGMHSKQQVIAEIQRAGFVDVETPDVDADGNILFAVARKPA